MAYLVARRQRLYCRVRSAAGRWVTRPTPHDVGDESKAQAWADRLQAEVDRAAQPGLTVGAFARSWLDARKLRGLASHGDDVGRITNHVIPAIGHLQLVEVKPRHVRDFLRDLSVGKLAPRTVINVYGIMSTMFDDAVIDELITVTPCRVKSGEKPDKVDADSEWRAAATYERAEVVTLVSDPRIPPERRVLNALKALAALRHGEAAGLRWRHLDRSTPTLEQLLIATSYNTGRTKTNTVRRVPVHPTLAAMLASWRVDHWPRVYGAEPTPDDLIVPTRTGRTQSANDAGRVFKRDLVELEMRVKAGSLRSRGGHDLRAWSITALQEAGANREIVASWTHTKRADVLSGYSRFSWAAMAGEMLKLDLVVDGDPLAACATHVTRDSRLRNRWTNSRPRRDSNPKLGQRGNAGAQEMQAVTSGATPSGVLVLPFGGTCHVTHAALLGPLRDYALTTDAIGVADELVARAAGRRGSR